uniref:AB hydrolase-1 domain-containing protein n=1 Tax=Strigamia maritima TaxID=126957 RepID=T1JHQ4_STRMM
MDIKTALMNLYGYKGENHSVNTDDGYILTMHRIPNANTTSIPILLLHGTGCPSDQFFLNGHTSPAFILADAGFDVWLANFRGNSYTSHKKYTTKDKQFWDFSWQEMAQQDLPHSIDYILNFTKHEKIILSGHSMGTTVGFALLSSQPSYNHKVAGYLPLAPAAFSNYMPQFIQIYNLFPSYRTRAPIAISRCRDGSSIKTIAHIAQVRTLKGMHQYTYGKEINQKRYNSSLPPAYNLSKISAPVVLFHAANDAACDPLDVALIAQKLVNMKAKELVSDPKFNHVDYMVAKNMKMLVYDKFIEHTKNLWKDSKS